MSEEIVDLETFIDRFGEINGGYNALLINVHDRYIPRKYPGAVKRRYFRVRGPIDGGWLILEIPLGDVAKTAHKHAKSKQVKKLVKLAEKRMNPTIVTLIKEALGVA